MRPILQSCFLIVVGCCGVFTASAQWTNQTITLRPGWNAVFLEIQPEPRDCDNIFTNAPFSIGSVESVWLWNRRFSTVQFIEDPSQLVPGNPDWLTYLPPSHPSRAIRNLFVLLGGRPYLIKMPDNASPVAWTIPGRPMVRNTAWLSDSLNFVGFPVDAAIPPMFQSFFAGSGAHSGQPIYRLNAGVWQRVLNPATTSMVRGEAFWIRCSGQSTYQGPLALTLEQAGSLDYGRSLIEQTLRIRNDSTTGRSVGIRVLPSAAPPTGNFAALAGNVPLASWKMNFPSNVGFFPLPALLTNTLPSGSAWVVRLAVLRTNMSPYTPPPGVTDVLYESLLEVTDGAGSRLLVPVTAKGLQTYAASGGSVALADASLSSPSPRAGLWVGSAVINKVNQPSNLTDANAPLRTPAEFQFRLLLHVDDSGQARLLQKAFLMWKDGNYTNDAIGFRVVDQPGHYVLVVSDQFVTKFSGSTIRDGQQVGRRFSSTAFGFRTPLVMANTGDFGADGSLFSCSVLLDYNDPLNPFIHRYHPDHDNLGERSPYPLLPAAINSFGLLETSESWAVNRQVQLQFTAADPYNLALPGWGDNRLGGYYSETITGLHKNTLYVQGTFSLQRASNIGVLNDGLGL
jgi:hypothetical protein